MSLIHLISWEQLLTYLFVFLTIYYAAVLAVCYRTDVLKLASRFIKSAHAQGNGELDKTKISDRDKAGQLYNRVLELMQDLKIVFTNRSNAPVNKSHLLEQINAIIIKYPDIRNTAFQVSITNHIDQEVEHRLGIKLSDKDLKEIWN